MTNVYSFHGAIAATLLLICACAYIRRVPRLRNFLLSERRGFWGAFYKGAVIGVRLHWLVSLLCVFTGFYTLFIK
eukprot:tig00020848_g14597.t1